MDDYRVAQAHQPEEPDIKFIEQRIREFNVAFIGYDDIRRLAIFLRGPQDEILGGIIGHTFWG